MHMYVPLYLAQKILEFKSRKQKKYVLYLFVVFLQHFSQVVE